MCEKKLYSVAELQKILPVSPAYLYRCVKDGSIPTVTVGTKKLIPGWWVDELINKPA